MKALCTTIKIVMVCYLAFKMSVAYGQQPPQYTQYMYNTAVLNSGYSANSTLEATLLHRSQWVGIDGAPETQSLSVQGKLRERISLGLTAINDNIGAANDLDINGTFAYEIPTGYTTKLSLGVNAGIDVLKVDWSKGIYQDGLDPVFAENVNKIRPVFGAGAYFYSSNWYVGLSTHNFLNSQIYNDDEVEVTDRKSQYYLMAGYVLDLSDNLKFKPAILTKHVAGAPITVDVSGNFLIKETLALGLAYRYNDAISALAGLHISKSFFLGYAYDYSTTGLKSYNDGSHEIILKYNLFNAQKRALSPRFF
ncbi:PorP/SprF family type IX secretion system membrane protein [Zobellia uliginosa]|uniref:PorP/SprF family type IX secretion system membrane protein n=1 Tax=Zobellia uliginosa TaxID=143224 RepID=UPI0026E250A7|nr:type IX secretion system membrane protein PorP/SprF [Zobellia uliginosa]MDO6516397.1 type IX secretion system membrane protein PorP/SprF [Zobellia uliginosa]